MPCLVCNAGSLTLTKIKDAFAVLKNLVLEGRASGTGASRSSSSMPIVTADQEDMVRQIKELKACLLQRDNEIAILVNMVKKGKTVEDVGKESRSPVVASTRDSKKSISDFGGDVSRDRYLHEKGLPHHIGGESPSPISERKQELEGFQKDSKARISSQHELQQQRDKEREERLIKRHIFGVPPPTDISVFEDSAASFDWFRERCALNASMEENRDILKNKISDAKMFGEKANQSRSEFCRKIYCSKCVDARHLHRSTITYLKNSIESIRRER